LANYSDFERRGFYVRSIFDINPQLIGTQIRGIEVRAMELLEEYLAANKVDIAAITVPKTKAPAIAADLVKWGIKGIWNFAPTDLNLPKDVTVENVHLIDSLMKLSYRLSGKDDLNI
jgi:redox-sensing transcriptional repressor